MTAQISSGAKGWSAQRGRLRTPLVDRFWTKVDCSDATGCWTWLAARLPTGYGQIGGPGRKTLLAHRVSYEMAHGEIPAGMFVCHRCDNPPCVNPAHLFLGSPRDNMQDCKRKGRYVMPLTSGENNSSARLTEAQAQSILDRNANGEKGSVLAAEHGITHSAVSALIHGHTWPNLSRSNA